MRKETNTRQWFSIESQSHIPIYRLCGGIDSCDVVNAAVLDDHNT
jgi:hypothetical protein